MFVPPNGEWWHDTDCTPRAQTSNQRRVDVERSAGRRMDRYQGEQIGDGQEMTDGGARPHQPLDVCDERRVQVGGARVRGLEALHRNRARTVSAATNQGEQQAAKPPKMQKGQQVRCKQRGKTHEAHAGALRAPQDATAHGVLVERVLAAVKDLAHPQLLRNTETVRPAKSIPESPRSTTARQQAHGEQAVETHTCGFWTASDGSGCGVGDPC